VTEVSTVTSANYRQHQRNQADGPLAALALGVLVFSEIRGFTWRVGLRPLGAVSCSGQGRPRGPDSASASVDYAGCRGYESNAREGLES